MNRFDGQATRREFMAMVRNRVSGRTSGLEEARNDLNKGDTALTPARNWLLDAFGT